MDALSKIGTAIAAIAPTIAGLFGGPLAQMGVTAVEGALGLAPGTATSNPDAVIAAINNPDAAVKLAQIDADLKTKLMQGGIDLAKMGIDDTANARNREVLTKDFMPKLLGLGTMITFLLVIGSIIWAIVAGKMPTLSTTDSILLGSILGYVVNDHKQVLAYYFGSSLGSASKDETIKSLSA